MSSYFCTRKHGKIYVTTKKEKELPVEEIYKKELPVEYVNNPSQSSLTLDDKYFRLTPEGTIATNCSLDSLTSGDKYFRLTPEGTIATNCSLTSKDSTCLDTLTSNDKYFRLTPEGTIATNCSFKKESSPCFGQSNYSNSSTSFTSGINLFNSTKGVAMFGSTGKSLPFPYSLQVCSGLSNTTGVSTMLRTEKRGFFPEGVGVADSWYSTATGYGEWFETDLTEKELIGYFVTIKEGKVNIAKDAEETIGVVVPRLAVVGNSAEMYWHKASLKDEFSSYVTVKGYPDLDQLLIPLGIEFNPLDDLDAITASAVKQATEKYPFTEEQKAFLDVKEDGLNKFISVLEQKIRKYFPRDVILPNPDYVQQTYIPRSKRKEWVRVCLKGRVNVRYENCKLGEKCTVKNGIAVPSPQGYFILNQTEKVLTILV